MANWPHPGKYQWLSISNWLSPQGSMSSWPHTSTSRGRSGTLWSRPTYPALWRSSCPRSPSGLTGSLSLPEQFLVSPGAWGTLSGWRERHHKWWQIQRAAELAFSRPWPASVKLLPCPRIALGVSPVPLLPLNHCKKYSCPCFCYKPSHKY